MADYSRSFQIIYDEKQGSCTIKFRCFDTPNSITIYGSNDNCGAAEEILLSLRAECLALHRLWSFTLTGSDIWRINQPCSRARVDVRTAALITAMKDFHDVEPIFDFTVGPISYLWKHAEHMPSENEIAAALVHVGADKVIVEDDLIIKNDPLVKVDVGGAAKGFVADAIVSRLRALGVTNASIDLGGNLFMLGNHPAGRPWRVAVHVPDGVDREKPVLEVCDQSVVTSGSYERFVIIDGKAYQHIIDVSTGYPSTSDIVSATVVAASSLQADMLATAALMVGSQGLDALRVRHPEEKIVAMTAT